MFIGDWLARRAMLTPHKVALIDTLDDNREITFQDWNRSANRTANFLRDQFNICKGDRVAVLAMNSVAYLDIWFALGKLGAILQNLNWRLSTRELIDLIVDADPEVLFYGRDFLPVISDLRAEYPDLIYVALDEKENLMDATLDERANFRDAASPEIELRWSDPWVICYTGGTTGTPKGAVLTHRSITANAINTVISWGLTADDVTILNSPLFHTGGLNVFTAPLVYVGGTSIVCREFDLEQTFHLLTEGEVTIWFGVPTMFVLMQNHHLWKQVDFSHLKLLISGGAPCPLPVFEKFRAKGVDFKTGYGLTEAGPNTFWLPPDDVRRKPGSVGFPLFHVDVRAVRADGSECAPDEVGELIIRGPHLCAGYWNNHEATAEAIRPLPSAPKGPKWLHTGDLARRDAEGYYYIVGRTKEMFISGGENVYPAEIESVLHACPAVAEAAVIAVPHETWGEVGRAVVTLKPNQQINEETLLEFVRHRLARYKVPKSVVFVDALPKTGANKVDKKLLADTYGSEELI
jgi:fatty-acyl-CoA synthase